MGGHHPVAQIANTQLPHNHDDADASCIEVVHRNGQHSALSSSVDLTLNGQASRAIGCFRSRRLGGIQNLPTADRRLQAMLP